MFWHLRLEWHPQHYIVHKIILFVFEGLEMHRPPTQFTFILANIRNKCSALNWFEWEHSVCIAPNLKCSAYKIWPLMTSLHHFIWWFIKLLLCFCCFFFFFFCFFHLYMLTHKPRKMGAFLEHRRLMRINCKCTCLFEL